MEIPAMFYNKLTPDLSFFVPTPLFIFVDGSPYDQVFTVHWPISWCLLPEPGLLPQSLSREVSDECPMHDDRYGTLSISEGPKMVKMKYFLEIKKYVPFWRPFGYQWSLKSWNSYLKGEDTHIYRRFLRRCRIGLNYRANLSK